VRKWREKEEAAVFVIGREEQKHQRPELLLVCWLSSPVSASNYVKVAIELTRVQDRLIHCSSCVFGLLQTFFAFVPPFVGCVCSANSAEYTADDVKSSFHTIEYEIGAYMARYEVR